MLLLRPFCTMRVAAFAAPLFLVGGGVAASAAAAAAHPSPQTSLSAPDRGGLRATPGAGAKPRVVTLPAKGGARGEAEAAAAGAPELESVKEESLVIAAVEDGATGAAKKAEDFAGSSEESGSDEDDESYTEDRIRWADEHGAPLLIFDPHEPRGVAQRKVLARGDRPLAVDWVQLMRVWAHDEGVWTETELLGVAGLMQAMRRTVSPTMVYASVLVLLLAALLLQPSDSGDHKTLSRRIRDVKLGRQQMQEQKERLQALRESADKSATQIKALAADEADSDFAAATLREIPPAIFRTAAQRAGLGAHTAVAGAGGPGAGWSALGKTNSSLSASSSNGASTGASANAESVLPQGFCAGSDWGLLAEATDMRLRLARDLAREPRALQQQLRSVLRVAEMRSEVLQLQQRQGVDAQTEADEMEDGGRGANDRSTEAADYAWFLGEARALLSQNTQEVPLPSINSKPSAVTERMQSVLLYGLLLQRRAEVWDLQKKGREEVKRAKKSMGLLSAPLSDIRSKLQGRVARYQAVTALALEKAKSLVTDAVESQGPDAKQHAELFRELEPSIARCLEALNFGDVQAVSAPSQDQPPRSPKDHRDVLNTWLRDLGSQMGNAAAEEAQLLARLGGARATAMLDEEKERIDGLREIVSSAVSSRTDLLVAVSRAQQQLAEVAAKHTQLSTEVKHHENVIAEINKSLRFMTVEMKRVKKLAEGRQ